MMPHWHILCFPFSNWIFLRSHSPLSREGRGFLFLVGIQFFFLVIYWLVISSCCCCLFIYFFFLKAAFTLFPSQFFDYRFTSRLFLKLFFFLSCCFYFFFPEIFTLRVCNTDMSTIIFIFRFCVRDGDRAHKFSIKTRRGSPISPIFCTV